METQFGETKAERKEIERQERLKKKQQRINVKERLKTFFIKNTIIIAKTICVLIICTLLIAGGFIYAHYYEQKKMEEYPFEVLGHEAELQYNENKSELVKAVKHYIDSVAPNSSLTAYAIVTNCEKYDLDIKFVLAQCQVESAFGTKGMATKTNSVFNVGAYDSAKFENINGKYKYKHPDYSIEPYMKLLYKSYITGNKTELDLMAKYVDKSGKRYASNPNYENDILNVYKNIDKVTNITELQAEMKRYKIICGK